MSFNFPNPNQQQTVTNEATGITYQWKETPGKWVIVANPADDAELDYLTERIVRVEEHTNDNANAISETNQRVTTLESQPAPKDYMIGTDKNITRITEPRLAPAIELVDSEGYFSNVKFEATGGLTVSSSPSAIIFDGSNIDTGGDVNLDNYYTKDEIDQQFAIRGIGYTFLLARISSVITIRPGEFTVDNRLAGQVTLITMGPEDENGHEVRIAVTGDIINLVDETTQIEYRYAVTSVADAGVYVVTYSDSEDKRDNVFGVGSPFIINVFPTHISASDYYTKVEADSKFLNKQGGIHSILSTVKYKGEMTDPQSLVTKEYVDAAIEAALSNSHDI